MPPGSVDLAGGVLSFSSAINRNLGSASGQIRWTSSGGFAGSPIVNLSGGATLTWGTGGFVPAGCELILGAADFYGNPELKNPVDLGGEVRTIRVNGTPFGYSDTRGALSGSLSNGGLTKTGPAVLQLDGANTYSGATIVSDGILMATDGVGLPTASNLVLAGGAFTTTGAFTRALGPDPGQVQWAGSGGFVANQRKMTINLGGGTEPGTVTWAAGGFVPAGAELVLGSFSSYEAELQNPVDLSGGTRTVRVISGSGALAGTVSDGSLTKVGPGLLKLSAANTYDGATTVTEGGLLITHPQALGSEAGPVVVASGAYLQLGENLTVSGKTLVLNGMPDYGALRATKGSAAWAGPIVLGSDALIRSSYPLTLSGPITGDGTILTLRGNGAVGLIAGPISGSIGLKVLTDPSSSDDSAVWTVSGNNTYSGPTIIGDATLRLAAAHAIPSDGLLLAGGWLDLNGFDYTANLPSGYDAYGAVVLGAGRLTLNVGSGAASFRCTIGGTGGVTKTGPGKVLINPPKDCTYTGSTVVAEGVLTTSLLPSGNNVTVAGGTFDIDAYPLALGSVTLSDGLITATTGYFSAGVVDARQGTISARMVGAGALTKSTPGTVILTVANIYTGPTTISAGTLRLGVNNAVPGGSSVTVQGGGTLDMGAYSSTSGPVTLADGTIMGTTGTLTGTSYEVRKGSVSAKLGGTGGLVKTTVDTVTLTAPNAYSGPTTLSGGALQAVSGVGLPTASNLVLNGGVLEGLGTTTLTRSLGTASNNVQWAGSGGFGARGGKMTVAIGGTGAPTALTWGSGTFVRSGSSLILSSLTADNEVEFRNPINLANAARTVWVNDNPLSSADFATLSGILSNGGLTKDGPGLLVLKGGQTYTGVTTIAAGTLKLAAGATMASGAYDVTAGATLDLRDLMGGLTLGAGKRLKGGGTVLGNLVVGGAVAPGESPGTLSVGNITFASASTLEIELGDTVRGTGYDVLASSGNVTIQDGSTLSVVLLDAFMPELDDEFDILDFAALTGQFTTINLPALGGDLTWNTSDLHTDGTISVAPEPTTLALLALGGLALLSRRRK